MFWKKKIEVIEVEKEEEEPQVKGFFSTEKRPGRKFDMLQTLKGSFQLELNTQINEGGEVSAMDSGSSPMQRAKSYYGTYGQNIPDAQISWYAGQGFIGYQLCSMIAQNWLVDKACSMPARDAVRKGFDITVNNGVEVDPQILEKMRNLDKIYKLNKNLVEFIRFGRVFGIRIMMFKVDSRDPDYYLKPFNPDGVRPGSYKGMVQVDPYWITPELDMEASSNPASLGFYEPTWWRINAQRIHKSHLVIYRTSEVSDILKPSYLYGGIPIPQKIAERVYAAERTSNEAPLLAMTKRITTLKVDTLTALADQALFQEKIREWTEYRDNFGVKVVGLDEEVGQLETSLTDLDEVIMTQYQIVAAAADVPATKLLGTQPKGFNSTGEYEEASYHEELESMQSDALTPVIERHHLLLIRSEIAPAFNIPPFDSSVKWNPLDSLTEKELAEVNKMKAETGSVLSGVGAIDGADERARIIADPQSGYNGISEEVPEIPTDETEPVGGEESGEETINQ